MSLTPTVSFIEVTTDQGGGPLTGLKGYRIYFGSISLNYSTFVEILTPCRPMLRLSCPPLIKYTTNYFRVTAFDESNNESVFSSEVSTFVSGGLILK